jgi:o-succinylbenzoate synthase
MKAHWKKHPLQFKNPAQTSRDTMTERDVYYLVVEKDGQQGVGECAPIAGLSLENPAHLEDRLTQLCQDLEAGGIPLKLQRELNDWPSLAFGLETAVLDMKNKQSGMLYDSPFSRGEEGLPVNGLIWMGDADFQRSQLHQLYQKGFRTIKFKIGLDYFEKSLPLLEEARALDPNLEIRVDANGAFDHSTALKVMASLNILKVHSIEQPLKVGEWRQTADLVEEGLVPVALDEDLIHCSEDQMEELLETAIPHYLILKPSLIGGIRKCKQWIDLAEEVGVGYWVTSALESNLGLNAVAQFASTLEEAEQPQGLGTGGLFENNLASPLEMRGPELWIAEQKPVNTDGIL